MKRVVIRASKIAACLKAVCVWCVSVGHMLEGALPGIAFPFALV